MAIHLDAPSQDRLLAKLFPGSFVRILTVKKHCPLMPPKLSIRVMLAGLLSLVAWGLALDARGLGQGTNGGLPASSGLRPINGSVPSTYPTMIPVNPATQAGIYPSNGIGGPTFDPYAATSSGPGLLQGLFPPGNTYPPNIYPQNNFPPNAFPTGNIPPGNFQGIPGYNGPNPVYPGVGPSGTIGSFPDVGPNYSQPGVYPNNAPSALFPSSTYGGQPTGSLFGGFFGGAAGGYPGGGFGGSMGQPGYPAGGVYPPSSWNPQGAVFDGRFGQPQYLRFFQGPRFRHAWVSGNEDADALMINDSDVSVAFAFPNFLYSTQPLYILPSFSLHQWDGPHPPSGADLPALAYSAFLDAGWQTDPARILGAELGLRVGMFSDFDTANADSLRVMGRGIGRVRLTPKLTFKLGAIYLDRNDIKLLPAGGLLWQPDPGTRFDLFFPEPKLAHYLATIGTADTWWYVGGYYGGGAWTIKRANGNEDEIDINDIRLVLGLEWGRNELLRDGRRFGFFEVGYVFDRELLYRHSPTDNLSLQDTFMLRAGIGY